MIKQLSTKIVYSNPWMTVHEDSVEFENGHKGIYGVVQKSNFSLIIPYEDDSFYLVGQYRYPVKELTWEFPQGKHEGDTLTPMEQIANSELQEEIGLKANSMKEIGFLREAPGYSTQGFHIFFATQLTEGKLSQDIAEAEISVKKVSVKEFEELVISGEIKDGPTLAAYAMVNIKKII